jgi:hypothetical protein
MSLSSDIILIGAGRHPATKQLRAQNGHQRRTFYIGELQIKSNLRLPVNLAFVQKYFDKIIQHIADGTLLVEYKYDTYVDPKELKTLAFGSDAEKQAYEEEISKGIQQQAEVLEQKKEDLRAEKQAEKEASEYGTDEERARVTDPLGFAPAGGGAEAAARSLRPEAKSPELLAAVGPNPDGEEPPVSPGTTPEEKFDSLREAADKRRAETSDPEAQLQEERSAQEGLEEEPEQYVPTGDEPAPREQSDDPNFKPLPKDWRQAAKPELLQLCAERGIDTSDMPSNKVLRQRLEQYGG